MDAPVAGDIFPAREAIDWIDQADLIVPVEIPPMPPEAEPTSIPEAEHRQLMGEIARLKKQENAYILAHNYAPSDIQDVADAVGDSLYLAQKGAESDAEILLEASVLFMNQILAIMKKPHQRVLAPDLGALCSLAAHADADKIRSWKREHPEGIVISYVNTYLDVKAESDYCCASANAAQVILHVLEHSKPKQPILFLPDVYLGFYAAKLLEQQNQPLDRLWLMIGACHVHDRIRPYHVEQQRRAHPDAAVVVHPECGCTSACMRQMAQEKTPVEMMQFRSTQGMVQFVRDTPQKVVIMATEVGNIYPLSKAAPDKTIVPGEPRGGVRVHEAEHAAQGVSLAPRQRARDHRRAGSGGARPRAHRADAADSLNSLIPKEFPLSGRNSPTTDFLFSRQLKKCRIFGSLAAPFLASFPSGRWNAPCPYRREGRWSMKRTIERWFRPMIGGGLLLALISGCGTLTGATLGGAAGAGIGAATHSNVGRSAAIGAGVGGTAGALYDVFGCCRHDHYRDYDD